MIKRHKFKMENKIIYKIFHREKIFVFISENHKKTTPNS